MPDVSNRLLHTFHIRFTVSTREDSTFEWKSGKHRVLTAQLLSHLIDEPVQILIRLPGAIDLID